MPKKRQVDIYSAGCAVCNNVVELVKETACSSCEINIYDMHDQETERKAQELDIKSMPAVVVDGNIIEHGGAGYNMDILRAAGIGQSIT